MRVDHHYAKEAGAEAAAITDTVTYEYSLVNNGLLSLYNISIRDIVLKEHGTIITCVDVDGSSVRGATSGELNGLASYPDNGLAPTAKLTCNGTDPVSQDEVLGHHISCGHCYLARMLENRSSSPYICTYRA